MERHNRLVAAQAGTKNESDATQDPPRETVTEAEIENDTDAVAETGGKALIKACPKVEEEADSEDASRGVPEAETKHATDDKTVALIAGLTNHRREAVSDGETDDNAETEGDGLGDDPYP